MLGRRLWNKGAPGVGGTMEFGFCPWWGVKKERTVADPNPRDTLGSPLSGGGVVAPDQVKLRLNAAVSAPGGGDGEPCRGLWRADCWPPRNSGLADWYPPGLGLEGNLAPDWSAVSMGTLLGGLLEPGGKKVGGAKMLGEALSCSSLHCSPSSITAAGDIPPGDGASFSRPPKVGVAAAADVPSSEREGSAGLFREEPRPEDGRTRELRLRATCVEQSGS